jgi:hypothetical protein
MEQACYKCGQFVDQGRPFCPHCAAPQIRVVMPEPVAALPSGPEAALAQSAVDFTAPQGVPLPALPMQWSQAVKPCAIAALIAAVGMVLKLIVPLVAPFGAGFLAVALYRRRNPERMVQARVGARLGVLCGFFCFAMTAILGAVRVAVMHEWEEIRRPLLEAVQQQAARYPEPQFQASLDFMRSTGGLAFMMACMALLVLLLFAVLGTLGGTLAGTTLGRRTRD